VLLLPEITDDLLDKLVVPRFDADSKGTIFCATDQAVLFMDRHSSELGENWNLFSSRERSLEYLMDKSCMIEYARAAGFSIPRTVVLCQGQEIGWDWTDALHYPCIVKPVNSLSVGKEFYRIVADKESLLVAAQSLIATCPKIMIQEYIGADLPGQVLEVFVLRSRMPPHVKKVCMISKERQYPYMKGSSSFIKSELIPDLYQPVSRFADLIAFDGIADIEVIHSAGEFFFIEANFRCGTPIALSQRAGLNLPMLAYLDTIGRVDEYPEGDYVPQIYWMRDNTDWKHVLERRISPFTFLRDVLRTDEFLILAGDDPEPFARYLLTLLKKGLRRSTHASQRRAHTSHKY